MPTGRPDRAKVVIVGGGFAGLNAARALRKSPVELTLIDRRNFHLFQPLLYQVATGGLSPADIAAPLRAIVARGNRARVLKADVSSIDVSGRRVLLDDGSPLEYDYLLVATGANHHYFGHDDWAEFAPGLKTVEDATLMRARILDAFERAEREPSAERKRALLTFAIIGGGPTGVELAGAIGELARQTLRDDFRAIDPRSARILLIEGTDRILPGFPPDLSARAAASLGELGVEIRTATMVTSVGKGVLTMGGEALEAETILWAAGVEASPLGKSLAEGAGAPRGSAGHITVEPDLSLANHPEVFVAGDLASFSHGRDEPLPGLAPVAIQQGRFVGRVIDARVRGKSPPNRFRYRDKGSLAVIGRARAVAMLGRFSFWGYPAWLLWLFVHLMYLVAFENRLIVFIQWAFSYVTRNRRARLITRAGGDGRATKDATTTSP